MGAPANHGYIDFVGDEEYFWFIETLWNAAASLPTSPVRLDDLPWREDSCLILGDEPNWGAFAAHCARVRDADLNYPIILSPMGDVMDGMHRIVRAFLEGRDSVPGVTLAELPEPDRIRPRGNS